MLMVAFTGRTCANKSESQSNDLFRGRGFLKIKNEEIENLDAEIGELYKNVYPNGKINESDGVLLPDDDNENE